MKGFINYFRYAVFSLVLYGVSSFAGSYDDFFRAIKRDDARAVQALIQRGFDPNTLDPEARHGLILALSDASLKVAEVLIEAKSTDLNFLSPEGESALMYAALKGHLALAAKLIDKQADVNKTGWTPLHYAATGGQVELIRLLLEHHAFVDAESPNGSTPLMMAAQYGSTGAVKLLLEEGAEPEQRNQQGFTPMDFARRGGRPDAQALIEQAISRRPSGRKP